MENDSMNSEEVCEFVLRNGMRGLVDKDMAHLVATTWSYDKCASGGIYASRKVRQPDGSWKRVCLHRLVMGYKEGDPILDHINGNTLDCRRQNLRPSNQTENGRNRGGANRNNKSSRFLGVARHRNKWLAHIKFDGKLKYLGVFTTEDEARTARLKAERELWGVEPREDRIA